MSRYEYPDKWDQYPERLPGIDPRGRIKLAYRGMGGSDPFHSYHHALYASLDKSVVGKYEGDGGGVCVLDLSKLRFCTTKNLHRVMNRLYPDYGREPFEDMSDANIDTDPVFGATPGEAEDVARETGYDGVVDSRGNIEIWNRFEDIEVVYTSLVSEGCPVRKLERLLHESQETDALIQRVIANEWNRIVGKKINPGFFRVNPYRYSYQENGFPEELAQAEHVAFQLPFDDSFVTGLLPTDTRALRKVCFYLGVEVVLCQGAYKHFAGFYSSHWNRVTVCSVPSVEYVTSEDSHWAGNVRDKVARVCKYSHSLKGTLCHELVHALDYSRLEGNVKKSATYQGDTGSVGSEANQKYYNSPKEYNAFFQEFVSSGEVLRLAKRSRTAQEFLQAVDNWDYVNPRWYGKYRQKFRTRLAAWWEVQKRGGFGDSVWKTQGRMPTGILKNPTPESLMDMLDRYRVNDPKGRETENNLVAWLDGVVYPGGVYLVHGYSPKFLAAMLDPKGSRSDKLQFEFLVRHDAKTGKMVVTMERGSSLAEFRNHPRIKRMFPMGTVFKKEMANE